MWAGAGDVIWATGRSVKRTKKGELSLVVTELALLSKAIRPLPDKVRHRRGHRPAGTRSRRSLIMWHHRANPTAVPPAFGIVHATACHRPIGVYCHRPIASPKRY